MHTIRNYIMAESLEQAWELNQKGRNNVIIGGNLWLKMGNRNILNAIDLSTLGLDRIEEDEGGFRIKSFRIYLKKQFVTLLGYSLEIVRQ